MLYYVGGALYFDFSNDLNWFQQGVFTGNEALQGSGGAIYAGCKVSGQLYYDQ
jgi:predicted outer membrane repeat protein